MKNLLFLWIGMGCILAQSTVSVNPNTHVLTQPTASVFYTANPPPGSSGTVTLTGSVTGTGSATIATTIVNVPWSTLTGSLTAAGDLQGSYPNPSVNKIQGVLPAAGVANALGNIPNQSGGFITFGNAQTPLTFGTGLTLTGISLAVSSSVALSSNNLSFFSSTTSAQLAGVISNETGTGSLVFAMAPSLTGSATLNGSPIQTAATFSGIPQGGPLTQDLALGGFKFNISNLGDPIVWLGSNALIGTDTGGPYLQNIMGEELRFDDITGDLFFANVLLMDTNGLLGTGSNLDFVTFFPNEGYSIQGSSGVFLQTDGFGGIDLPGNLTVDSNIDLADHYFLIDSTTGYITSSQNYVPFGVVVEATQGLSVANGLAFDSINSTGSPCDISAATVSGNLMSGLFDGTANLNVTSLVLSGTLKLPEIYDVIDVQAIDVNDRIGYGSDGFTQVFNWSTVAAFKASVIASNFTSDTSHAVLGDGTFLALPTGALVGISDTQTLTNKTIGAVQLTGTIATARLGSGMASSSTALFGDQTYKSVAGAITTVSGSLTSGSSTQSIVSGVHPWVQNTNTSSLTNVGEMTVSLSGTLATIKSSNVLDTSTYTLFYGNF